jgi:hypothetical protein
VRADQAEYEELNKQLNLQRHVLKANAVWDLPDLKVTTGAGRAIGLILHDWQLSGILTATRAAATTSTASAARASIRATAPT